MKRLILSSPTLIVGLVILAWGAYMTLRPEPKTLPPARREIMRDAVAELLKKCPRPAQGLTKLAVAPLAGDITGETTREIRKLLDAEGVFNVAPAALSERLRKRLVLSPPEIQDEEAALRFGRRSGAAWVLWGAVDRLSQGAGGTVAELELHVNDVESKASLWSDRVLREKKGGLFAPEPSGGFWSGMRVFFLRLFLCIVAIVVISLAARPLLRPALERESNAANFAVLASMTAADAVVVLMLLYGALPVFFYVSATVVLTIAAAWYNYWYCEMLDASL
jgi:hypothetical protein